ncbi:hypothetical protein [Corynebacterium sp. 321]|uniref:hypothetical protein n=1 Tax=Corynebacterium sp. 321 TaxID=2651047 RepID=UPI0013014D75|nr:hypothetical protein [Corynebacterium sp. 321]KAB1551426.1 hypothetical protein F7233_07930 [Corynebacterium sp. 321]
MSIVYNDRLAEKGIVVTEVEIATCDWVNWCNEIRLQQTLGYRTPVDVGEELWAGNLGQEIMDITTHV